MRFRLSNQEMRSLKLPKWLTTLFAPITRRIFMSSLGVLVTQWALIEHLIDEYIHMAYAVHRGAKLEARTPRTFMFKAKFLDKFFRCGALPESFNAEGLWLVKASIDLAKRRNDIVHGVAINLGENFFGVEAQKFRHDTSGFEKQRLQIHIADLFELSDDFDPVVHRWFELYKLTLDHTHAQLVQAQQVLQSVAPVEITSETCPEIPAASKFT